MFSFIVDGLFGTPLLLANIPYLQNQPIPLTSFYPMKTWVAWKLLKNELFVFRKVFVDTFEASAQFRLGNMGVCDVIAPSVDGNRRLNISANQKLIGMCRFDSNLQLVETCWTRFGGQFGVFASWRRFDSRWRRAAKTYFAVNRCEWFGLCGVRRRFEKLYGFWM